MIQKEQRMMKLVNYHFIYMGPGRVSKERKERVFVEVYNHFNKNRKKKLKRSDIVAYMSELRKQEQQRAATTFGRVAKRAILQRQGRTIALAIGLGLMEMALITRKRTED